MKRRRTGRHTMYNINNRWKEDSQWRKITDLAIVYSSNDKPYVKSMVTGQKYYFNQVRWQ